MMGASAGGLAVLCGAAALGLAAAVGTAAAGAGLAGALIVAAAVEAAAAVGGFALILRRSAWRWRLAVGAGTALVVVSAAAVGLPPNREPVGATPVAGQAFWHLPSGSVIRYVHVPARGRPHRVPVVFLHGGPGVADLAGDSAYFGRLAADGYDVYVYDELGAGGSSRPTELTDDGLRRDVTDLEQIRRTIGAPRLNLIGLSYGGKLAAGYLAAHPDRVRRMVLLSPGSLDPRDTSSNGVQGRLSLPDRLSAYAAVAAPRPLLAYALLQVNPADARALFPDAEADARNDLVLQRSEPALHCPGAARLPTHYAGTGFYRLQYPQSAAAPPAPDIRPYLRGRRAPTLIVKGSCDYLSWHSAIIYRTLLPNATLVYLPGAGHNVYQDRPGPVLAAIRAFLAGRKPALRPYTSTAVPPGYEGPH